MRILLDENFPVDFAKLFIGYEVLTVHSLGWSGIKNGELLRRAHNVCDVFVTLDRNLEFQQNIKVLPFGVVVVGARSNRVADLIPHLASILEAASRVSPGRVEKAERGRDDRSHETPHSALLHAGYNEVGRGMVAILARRVLQTHRLRFVSETAPRHGTKHCGWDCACCMSAVLFSAPSFTEVVDLDNPVRRSALKTD